MTSFLTTSELLGAASQLLLENGYQPVDSRFPDWDSSTSRLFEDRYSVVGIVVFDNPIELLSTWTDLQGSLVNVISKYIGHVESKSWDGYLVLMTPSILAEGREALADIRYNTSRVRKIIATGEDLQSLADLERFMRPLLPLRIRADVPPDESVLHLLPELLAQEHVPEHLTRTVIQAFVEQAPILERLQQRLLKK
jgi:hypothetical protein